ncbi:hypothetical protein [Coleofasciculus sp. FACHB-SPT9]|nr:hypothetical protein [Coleofasciculus sp. FACHB-SPT9]
MLVISWGTQRSLGESDRLKLNQNKQAVWVYRLIQALGLSSF